MKLKSAVRAALLGSTAGLALLSPFAAQAQSAASGSAAGGDTVEQVVVTGTNIRGVAPVGSQIVTLGRDDIIAAGAVTTAQLLLQMPQVTNLGISEQSRAQANGSGNGTYATGINLRGIGAYTTLTLIDGRRVVPQGVQGNTVDPSIIPALMLQRIDVLADGASATYGSDAIAGVVNLIPRRNVEGVEASAAIGAAHSYDLHQLDLLVGHRWHGGQLTVGVEDLYHSHLNGSSRDFFSNNLTALGGSDFRTTNCTPGNVTFTDPATRIAYSYAVGPNGTLQGTGTGAGVVRNLCDPGKLADLLPKQSRYSLAFTADQEINDRISVNALGIATRRTFAFNNAPGGSTLQLPSTSPFYISPPAGATPPFCAGSTTVRCETVSFNTLGYVPVGRPSGYAAMYQLNLGADAKLFRDWKASPLFTYGVDMEKVVTDTGLASGGQAPGTAALANGFNPFASTQPASAINPANPAQAFTNALTYATGRTRLTTANLTLDGTVVQLPGGPVKAAFGYQYQKQVTDIGLVLGTVQIPNVNPVTGFRKGITRRVNSFFGELDVPVFGPGNAVPGFRSLEIDASLRTDAYLDTFRGVHGLDATTRNPKIGVNWSPVADLKIRASYGTSFRAPVFSQEYGNSNQLIAQAYTDANPNPSQGVAPGTSLNYVTMTGPNPDLVPETATTKSLGFDYTPSALPGLNLSLTYFDIDYKGAIANYVSNVTILSSAASEGLLAGTGIIVRNPSDAFLNSILQFNPNGSPVLSTAGPFATNAQFPCYGVAAGSKSPVVGFSNLTCNNYLSGAAVFIDGRNKNLGVTQAKGIDFQLLYHWDAGGVGDLGVGVTGTYFTRFYQASTPAGIPVDVLNTTFNPLRFKFRASLDWRLAGYSARLFLNYQNGYHNLTAPLNIPSWTSIDAHLAYSFGSAGPWATRDLTVALDVNNLFDRDPPFVNIAESPSGGGGGSDPVNSNPIGRLVQVSLHKRF